MHAVALVPFQAKVPPVKESVGAGDTLFTTTDTLVTAVPPAPAQEREYVVVTAGVTTTPVTFDGNPPVEKFVPVQEEALVELQVMVLWSPVAMEEGEAVMVAVGMGANAAEMVWFVWTLGKV